MGGGGLGTRAHLSVEEACDGLEDQTCTVRALNRTFCHYIPQS